MKVSFHSASSNWSSLLESGAVGHRSGLLKCPDHTDFDVVPSAPIIGRRKAYQTQHVLDNDSSMCV